MAVPEIVPRDHLASESTEALRERLTRALLRTADDLREMAAIVGELEARGEDLSTLRLGLVDHLRRIAAGQLLPDLVVRLSGFPLLLRHAAVLPLPDQRRLAQGDPVPLAVWREGRVEFRQVDPLTLSAAQTRQIFARARLRTEAEQVSVLEERAANRRPFRAKRSRVWVDRERGGIVVGRAFAPHDEVLRALAELAQADYDDDAEGEAPLVVKLAEAELRQIKTRAARTGTTMTRLVRRALAAAGLLRENPTAAPESPAGT